MRTPGWEKLVERNWKVLRLSTSSVGEYNVIRKTFFYIGTPLHRDLEQVAYQDSLVCRGPLGAREPIVHISLEQLLEHPPLVRVALVLCDSDLVRCESK